VSRTQTTILATVLSVGLLLFLCRIWLNDQAIREARRGEREPSSMAPEFFQEQIPEKAANRLEKAFSFYGKVVDENGSAIPHANVEFSCTRASSGEVSVTQSESSSDGTITVTRAYGSAGSVRVSKENYFERVDLNSYRNFTVVDGNIPSFYSPNPAKPALFVLQNSVASNDVVEWRLKYVFKAKEEVVGLDLMKKEIVKSDLADVVFEYKAERLGFGFPLYDWSVHISAPSGGLCERSSELDFIAPVDGYLDALAVVMHPIDRSIPDGGNGFSFFATKDFFVRSRQSTIYARIRVEMEAGDTPSLRILGYTNMANRRSLQSNKPQRPGSDR